MEEHVSPAAKERVVQDLAEHFAQDRLTLPEYERRVELAYRAGSADALRDLTRDLAPPPPVRVPPKHRFRLASSSHPRLPARTRNFFALMSGVIRRGNWTVPAKSRAVAFMGGVSLDLREATLTAPVTDIYIFAMMGGVEVIVPPDVRLESRRLCHHGWVRGPAQGTRLTRPKRAAGPRARTRDHGRRRSPRRGPG